MESKRPLGIPTVRDRVIQMATKLVIEPIFEADFQEVSFGFRPKRSAKQALERIRKACNRKGNWVVDVDIQGYFDNINQEKLMKLVEMRINDRRILKLITEVARCGSDGRRKRQTLGFRHAARRSDLTVTGEHLSELLRSLVGKTWEASREN